MKEELAELIEQMDEIIDPVMVMARGLYRKMGENKALWTDLAKCYKTAVDAFVEAGFSREESISMAIASLNNLGMKKEYAIENTMVSDLYPDLDVVHY